MKYFQCICKYFNYFTIIATILYNRFAENNHYLKYIIIFLVFIIFVSSVNSADEVFSMSTLLLCPLAVSLLYFDIKTTIVAGLVSIIAFV